MTIRVECDQCFKVYNVADERLGQRLKCKACGNRMLVGSEDFAEEAPVALPPRSGRSVASSGRAKAAQARQSKSRMPFVLGGIALVVLVAGGVFVVNKMMGGADHPSADGGAIAANGTSSAGVEHASNAPTPVSSNAGESGLPMAATPSPVSAATSWPMHDAPEGWYQVRFPEAPQLAEQEVQIQRQPMMLYRAGVMRGNADAMMVFYSDPPMVPGLGTKATDEVLVDQSVKSLVQAFQGTDAKTEPIEREGVHGMTCTFKTPAGVGESHVMLIEGRMFQLSALRSSEGGYSESDLRTFLDSFTFTVPTEAPEWTVEELQRKWKTLPTGTLVRVSGRIASISSDVGLRNKQLNVAVALFTWGINSSNPFALLNPADAKGLVPGQDIVLQGRVYPTGEIGGIGLTRIISHGDVPPHSAEPFTVPSVESFVGLGASPLVTTPREGLSVEGYANLVMISSADLLTPDGELIPEVVDGFRATPSMTGIHIAGIQVKQNLIAQLAKLPQLRDVMFSLGNADDVQSLSIKDIDFSPLAALKSLKSFSIIQLPNVSDAHLKQISTFPCLQYLYLSTFTYADVTLSDDGFSALSKLQSLVSLRIESLNGSDDVYYSDAFLAGFRNHPNLAALALSSDGLKGSCFAALATCPRLSDLHLTSYKLSEDSFSAFTRDAWSGLREITIGGFDDYASLANAQKVIEALPDQIHSITLYGGAIDGTTIDAIVARKFAELWKLEIPMASIKDSDAEKLSAIKTLSSLFLPPSISPATRDKLKASLPEGLEIL